MTTRRELAAARRCMRDDPRLAVEVVIALLIDEAEDGEEDALTGSQVVSLVWWHAANGECDA